MVKEATSLKLEKNIMERIKAESKKENRPISNYIETVLIKHFECIDKQEEKEKPAE